ncbi:MAG: hypothetical protein ACLRM8_00175 [Alistipes sp.]
MKTRILPLLAVALLCNCGGSDDKEPERARQRQHHGRRTDDGVGRPERRHLPLQLKPGKLITLKQVNTTNCKRAAAPACASTSWRGRHRLRRRNDRRETRRTVFRGGSGNRLRRSKPLGIHLPYRTYDISATDEAARTTAVAKLRTVINSAMKHMSPKHFVIHPRPARYSPPEATSRHARPRAGNRSGNCRPTSLPAIRRTA